MLRPGRLDKSLICDLPDLEDRIDILRALGKKLKLSDEITSDSEHGLREIALRTEGYSGADLQAVVYNAHLEAIHDVLGDHNPPELGGKKNQAKSNGVLSSSKKFLQFRYGEEEDREDARSRALQNKNKLLAERAAIALKLDEIKQAKKRAKLQQRGLADVREAKDEKWAKEEKEEKEVVISWKHLEHSLQTTRASISAEERRRLQGIYREFDGHRNGEMPSGEGARDVGGRTSLM